MGFTVPYKYKKSVDDSLIKKWFIPETQVFNASDGTYRSDVKEVEGSANFSQTTQTTVNSSSIYFFNGNKAWKYIKEDKYNRNTNEIRVKENKYGFAAVQSEVIAAKFAGLTGVRVPHTYFCTGAEIHNEGLIANLPKKDSILPKKDPKEPIDKEPIYFVASQRLRGYVDLSTFIDTIHSSSLSEDKTLYDSILPEGDSKKRNEFFENYTELTGLRSLPDTNSADNKLKKRDCMVSCFNLMPQEIKDMMEEAYIASAWINHWDMFNWDLTNMGFTVLHKEDGIEINPAIIDFGNCLYMGFGGQHAEDCVISANLPAKIYSDNPANIRYHDYDPKIPDMYKISAASVAFNGHPALLCAVIDKEMREKHRTIPRSLPFAGLYKDINTQMLNCLEEKRNENNSFSKGLMRGLFGISLITDEAIDAITTKWFHLDKNTDFTSQNPKFNYSKEQFAGIMKERRDNLCKIFAPEIQQYMSAYPEEAQEKADEVISAIDDLTISRSTNASPSKLSMSRSRHSSREWFSALSQDINESRNDLSVISGSPGPLPMVLPQASFPRVLPQSREGLTRSLSNDSFLEKYQNSDQHNLCR